MLGAGQHAIGGRRVAALDPAHLRLGHAAAEIGVLPCPFDDAAPARVARDVDHRREGPVQAGGARLLGGERGGLFHHHRIPAGGERERHGQDRAVSVDHVHREQERDTEARFLDRNLLQLAQRLGAGDVEEGAHLAAAHAVHHALVEARVERLLPAAGDLVHLADLLSQRHLADQLADARAVIARTLGDCDGRPGGGGEQRARLHYLTPIDVSGIHTSDTARRSRAER